MIIHCPNCNARYTLTEQQLGPSGRSMRCAKCSQTWFQPRIETSATPAQKSSIKKAPLAPQPKQTEKRDLPHPTPILAIIATAASVAALAVGGGIWWMLSTPSATQVPQNYSPAALSSGETGQVHAETGLVLSHIEREIIEDDKVTLLLFRGRVTNTNTVTTPLPEIRVQLLNQKGVELDFWPAEISEKQLEPGKQANWVVRFLNPPLEDIAQYKAFFKTY